VQLIERLAALGADQKWHGQTIWSVDDQHRRERLAGPRVTQLATRSGGGWQCPSGDELGHARIVKRRQAPGNLSHLIIVVHRRTVRMVETPLAF
jgi:hypothetical protein